MKDELPTMTIHAKRHRVTGESERKQNMTYRIRAHHGMCFAFFRGKGYSGEFTENMWTMKKKLKQNPEVILLRRTDDVCAHCPNNRAGECTSAGKVESYDSRVLALCGLEPDTRIRWNDFEELVREHILSVGRREVICGDCQWNEICRTEFAK